MSFPLENARLCMDCDTVFDGPLCPSCSSETYFPLSRWIRPSLEEVRPKPEKQPLPLQGTVAQLNAQGNAKNRGAAARNASLVLAGGGLAYAMWRAFMSKGKSSDRVEEIAKRSKSSKGNSG